VNRSAELVPQDGTPIPAAPAQFVLDALPLRPTLTSSAGPLRIDLTPEQTLTLHNLA
jgi:hypothetical protein